MACEHATRLRARGHEVLLLAPPLRPPLDPARRGRLSEWKHFAYELFSGRIQDGLRPYGLADAVRRVDPSNLGEAGAADATVATAWNTAEWVHAMPSGAGRKYYFIQGYEAWTEALRPRVDATWRLPLRKLVVAHWLERKAREEFGTPAVRIPNGVDARRFAPPVAPPAAGSPRVVGMIYDLSPWKGTGDGLAAFEAILARSPATRLALLGRARVRHRVPPGTRIFRDPPQSELPRAYQAMDVFLSPSLNEGFSLVTLEAMASGCALVATAVGEAPVMGRPGEDYLIVEPGRPQAMAAAALSLLEDPARLAGVRAAGRALAQTYSWDAATDRLEAALSGDYPE